MSIDMTTVKEITHNNKEVVKIEDSNGNILWQKNVPVQTDTITLTVGSGQNITTTQYYDHIVIPSKNTIKNKINSLTGRTVIDITNVKVGNLKALRTGYTTTPYYNRFMLLNGNSISSTVIEAGLRAWSIMQSGYANKTVYMFTTSSSGTTPKEVDITNYLPSSNTSTKSLYGGISYGTTESSASTTTAQYVFSTSGSTGSQTTFTNAGYGVNTRSLPTYQLIIEYTY